MQNIKLLIAEDTESEDLLLSESLSKNDDMNVIGVYEEENKILKQQLLSLLPENTWKEKPSDLQKTALS